MKKHLEKISKYKPSALQGTLHLEVSRPRVGLAVAHPYEGRALTFLSIALVVLVVGYLYFVTASIFNVIARSEALRQTDEIESSIGSLEQRYLALSQEVSPQTGMALGLSPISNTSYVYRPGNAAMRPVASNSN